MLYLHGWQQHIARMENADEADEAYDRVHGKTLEGRRLTLEWARDPGAGRHGFIQLIHSRFICVAE